MSTTAYKYALRTPLNWGDDCEEQMRLANEFWNTLVTIEHQNAEERRAIINEPQELVDLNAEILRLQEIVTILVEEKKKLNKAARKNAKTPDIDGRIKTYKAQLKPLYEAAKVARKASVEQNKPLLDELSKVRFEKIKLARQEIAAKGLWWGNYNATADSFNVAVSRSYKDGGVLKIKKFRGEGRLTNQIQGGVSVEDLLAGRNTQVQMIEERWEYKGAGQVRPQEKQRYHLKICAYANGRDKRMLKFPIVYHRPLPEDAIVKMVAVKRIKEFDRWKWFVVFTLDIEDTEERKCGYDVATVNFGWRKTEEGIRIATVLRNGHIDYVLYPEHIWRGQMAGEYNRGVMDKATNEQVAWLRQIPLERAPEQIQEIITTILGYKRVTGGHFEWLREKWRIGASHWQPEFLKELESFCADWRLYSRTAAAGRQWVEDARQYFYRAEVRRLLEGVGTVVVNAHNMSATAKKELSTLPREVQHQRFLTAPSEFRAALAEYARKVGMEVVVDEAAHDVCACHGAPFVDQDRQALMWDCPVDGRELDQDCNYVHLMLQRYSEEREEACVDA